MSPGNTSAHARRDPSKGHRTAGRTRTRLFAGTMAAMLALPIVGTSVAAQDGEFDPMRYAGCSVNIALVDGERDEKGLQDLEPQIEAETGINIELTTLELNTLLESNDQNLRADESAFDIMHVLGFSVAGTVGAGLFEPLNDYLNDPSRVPADYDVRRLPVRSARVHRLLRSRRRASSAATRSTSSRASTAARCCCSTARTCSRKQGIDVPTTWADYVAAAEALTTDDVAGSAMVGANDVSNFLVDWYSRFITMGGQLTSGEQERRHPRSSTSTAPRAWLRCRT